MQRHRPPVRPPARARADRSGLGGGARRRRARVLVEGEAGVGKTRLLEEALRGMLDAGRRHARRLLRAPAGGAVHAVGRRAALRPRASRATTRGGAAHREVAGVSRERLPDLVEFGSLLNPLLDLSLPQSEVVASLDAQTRRQKLFELVARILVEAGRGARARDRRRGRPLDGRELARAVGAPGEARRAMLPLLLLLTTRPTGDASRARRART